MFNLYSMEADNDDIDIDVSDSVTINDETAIDEAGEDSETVDVSNISESQAAHNEAASAGGIATGNNTDQIEMDPVAAEEAYIMRHFGLSREDLEEAVDETVQEADAIPNAEVEDVDDELEATSAGTTVNISSPVDTHVDINAADEVEVDTDAEEVDNSTDSDDSATSATPAIETAADIATLEGLRRLWSTEDDDPDGTSSDVEFDVRTPENDVNIELEGRAVTIEPNEGGDDDYSADDTGSETEDTSSDEEGGDEVEEPETAEEDASPEGDEGSDESSDEGSEESLLYWL